MVLFNPLANQIPQLQKSRISIKEYSLDTKDQRCFEITQNH